MTFLLDNLLLVGIALASGGLLLWPLLKRGAGSATLSPLEATQLINHDNAVIVDIRDEKDFALGSLAGARNLPQAALAQRASELVRFKARPLLIICDSGQHSTKAIPVFQALGFADVRALAGGIAAWKQAALPLVLASRAENRPAARETGRRGKGEHRGRQPRVQGAPALIASSDAGPLSEASVAPIPVSSTSVAPIASPTTSPVTSRDVTIDRPATDDRVREIS